MASQAGSQASQACQAGSLLPLGEGSSLATSQAGSQASQASQAGSLLPLGGRKQFTSLAGQAVRPPRQALSFPLGKEAV